MRLLPLLRRHPRHVPQPLPIGCWLLRAFPDSSAACRTRASAPPARGSRRTSNTFLFRGCGLHGIAEEIGLNAFRRRISAGEFVAQDPFSHGPELESGKDVIQGRFIPVLEPEILFVKFNRDVKNDRRQLLAQYRHLFTCPDLFSQRPLDLVGIGHHIFQATPFRQQLGRGLFPHALDPGNIVDGIAHQPQDIDHLGYIGDIPFFTDFFWSQDLGDTALIARFIDLYLFGHELSVILIRCDHEYFITSSFGLFAQRTDDIVGFESVKLHAGDVEPFDDGLDIGKGADQILRGFLAVGLILGKVRMAFRRGVCIKTHGHMRGLLVVDQVDQGIRETELRIGVASLGCDPRAADQRIIGAEDQRHGVQEEDSFIRIFHSGEIRDFPDRDSVLAPLMFLVFCLENRLVL